MRLGKYLTTLTKPELEEIKELLNLTDDEEMIFLQLSKGRGNIAIADNCKVSLSFVDSRVRNIKFKLNKLGGGLNGNKTLNG